VAGWSLANVVLTVAIQAAIEFLVTDVLRMRSLLQIKGSKWGLNHLPYPWTMIKHAIMGLLARNVSHTSTLNRSVPLPTDTEERKMRDLDDPSKTAATPRLCTHNKNHRMIWAM
jgi:hypothetical protein